jgi:hypothetical protein
MSSASYRALLRTPGAALFFVTGAVGRVGIAMTSLGIVWLVHARTGSYATAGLVTGAFALAEAAAGPQQARLMDRFGQGRILPSALLAHAAAAAALLALVAVGSPGWLMATGGVAAGATIPQLGALSAARWAALLRGGRTAALPAAFALESLANELAYLVGPVLVSILGASGYPAAGTVLAATLVVAGGLCFAAQRRTAPPSPPSPTSPTSPGTPAAHDAAPMPSLSGELLRPGFAILAGMNLAVGCFFGAMQISVTAFAVEHGAAGAAPVLFTVSSCASLLAGWLYGLRPWRSQAGIQLGVAAAALAFGCLPLLVVGSLLALGLNLALTGLAIPPLLVLCALLAESAVHPSVLTQAFAWLNSASAAGSAGAAAVAGWAVDSAGAHGGFMMATVAAGAMALLAVAGRVGTRTGAAALTAADQQNRRRRTRRADLAAGDHRGQVTKREPLHPHGLEAGLAPPPGTGTTEHMVDRVGEPRRDLKPQQGFRVLRFPARFLPGLARRGGREVLRRVRQAGGQLPAPRARDEPVPQDEQDPVLVVLHRGEHDRREPEQVVIDTAPVGKLDVGQAHTEPRRPHDRLLAQCLPFTARIAAHHARVLS